MRLVIEISENDYSAIMSRIEYSEGCDNAIDNAFMAIAHGKRLTSDILADLLMEERIRGELRQDISYSKDVIDDVKCRLDVSIRDHRSCYCGAELREVWRESEE